MSNSVSMKLSRPEEKLTYDCPVALSERCLLPIHPPATQQQVDPGVDERLLEQDLAAESRSEACGQKRRCQRSRPDLKEVDAWN